MFFFFKVCFSFLFLYLRHTHTNLRQYVKNLKEMQNKQTLICGMNFSIHHKIIEICFNTNLKQKQKEKTHFFFFHLRFLQIIFLLLHIFYVFFNIYFTRNYFVSLSKIEFIIHIVKLLLCEEDLAGVYFFFYVFL